MAVVSFVIQNGTVTFALRKFICMKHLTFLKRRLDTLSNKFLPAWRYGRSKHSSTSIGTMFFWFRGTVFLGGRDLATPFYSFCRSKDRR
jgi:hypothetical protein